MTNLVERMAKAVWKEQGEQGFYPAHMDIVLSVVLSEVEEAVKPLRIFNEQRNYGYGITTTGAMAVIDQTLANIDEMKGEGL